MPSPRDRIPDLSLEGLGDREGLRPPSLGETAHVRFLEESTRRVGGFSAAYQALMDAVFTAPGASVWLSGMWQRVSARFADRDAAQPAAAARDAIRAAAPRSERG